jgi:hypothetical protein
MFGRKPGHGKDNPLVNEVPVKIQTGLLEKAEAGLVKIFHVVAMPNDL